MRIFMLLLSLTMLLLLTGCNSSGTLQVINRTAYNVYFSVEGVSYTVPGNSTQAVEIDTKKQTILTGVVEKNVPLEIFGETWMIRLWDGETAIYVKNTTVQIRSGETTKVYCDPILAAVKIKNHGTQAITAMTYTINQPPIGEFTDEVILPDSIQTNEEFFTPLPPADPENLSYFTFHLRLSDGTWLEFGDQTTILYVNQEYIIDVYDPVKQVAAVP